MVGDFEKRGMRFVGHSEDDVRMEIMELEGESNVERWCDC